MNQDGLHRLCSNLRYKWRQEQVGSTSLKFYALSGLQHLSLGLTAKASASVSKNRRIKYQEQLHLVQTTDPTADLTGVSSAVSCEERPFCRDKIMWVVFALRLLEPQQLHGFSGK